MGDKKVTFCNNKKMKQLRFAIYRLDMSVLYSMWIKIKSCVIKQFTFCDSINNYAAEICFILL